MSFFGFGKRRSAIESNLVERYAQMLAAQFGSISQGRKVAEEWLDQVKAEGEAEGTINVTNFAELMLNSKSPELQAKLQAKRADGVTDADIQWWWGLHDL